MKTYAVVYRFADERATQEFQNAVVNTFQKIREKDTDVFHYIGFAGGEEPEIADKLAGIIRHFGYNGSLSDDDYVGVYFTPPYDQEEITRQMVFGKDQYLENDVTPNYRPEHISIITDLLDYDPVTEQSR